jgi:hypothetical protein
MKILGRSQIGLTMSTCTHVLPESERAAADSAADSAAETIFGAGHAGTNQAP